MVTLGQGDWPSAGYGHLWVLRLTYMPLQTFDSLQAAGRFVVTERVQRAPMLTAQLPEPRGLATGRLKSLSENFWKWLNMLGWLTEFSLKDRFNFLKQLGLNSL